MAANRPLPEELRILEQTRQRLQNITQDLRMLEFEVQNQHPLPPWSRIQNSTQLLARHLQSLQQILTDKNNSKFLNSAHVYPLPSFPTRDQDLLYTLIRKKLELDVEDWVAEGVKAAQPLTSVQDPKTELDDAALMDLWDWAPGEANNIIRQVLFEQEEGDEEGEDEEEDEEEEKQTETQEKMQGVELKHGMNPNAKIAKLDNLLRFMITGVKDWVDDIPPQPNGMVHKPPHATAPSNQNLSTGGQQNPIAIG